MLGTAEETGLETSAQGENTIKKTNGHGGARRGAGRKPKVPSAKSAANAGQHLPKRQRARPQPNPLALPQVCPNAAGIDVGAEQMFVAVPEDRAQPNVRNYPTFTDDLCGLADWLKACGIENVAMEATGVYWIPIFQILEKRGFKVTLVNARHAKNVPGRKSDVRDSRWIQFLHSVGLLQGAFRPADEICALRAYMRHRDKLVAVAASHTLRMQKALTQMNIQIHNVISDITGVSGLAILDSILEGQRDPAVLASLCHSTIKADREVVRKSLVGDWRPEHLFALSQELRAYRFCQELIQECDTALERLLEQSVAARVAPDTTEQSVAARVAPDTIEQSEPVHEYFPPEPVKPRKNASVKTARISRLTTFLHALFGTDVTLVPGLAVEGVYKLYTELGPDLEAFPTDRHFCSYLGLCPDNRVSGGKVLSAKTRHVPSRAATIFRIAANSLDRSQTPLGDYLRRMKARLGKQEGITATAHKLARIFYHLVTTGETYDETRLQPTQSELKRRTKNLIRQATKLGYTVTPNLVPQ